VLGAFVAAFLIPKTRKSKTIVVAVVAVLFAAFPGRWFWEMQSEANAKKARLAKAEAMFQERCKTAGEFIHRTVEDVEGVFLLKLRPKEVNYGDQYRMDDPYGGNDYTGTGYFKIFLKGKNAKGSLVDQDADTNGYRYVDAIDPKDGKRYRYTGARQIVGRKDADAPTIQVELKRNPDFDLNNYGFVVDRVPAPDPVPRYGVTYDDISTLDDRNYWIAGSSLRVIDLQTDEVIAERIGYMMDRGQGALSTGGSNPTWSRARKHACPPYPEFSKSRDFVEKVLNPKKEK